VDEKWARSLVTVVAGSHTLPDRTAPARLPAAPPADERPSVVTPIDPTSLAFLMAENRSMPMHVGGLQLFENPADAGPGYTREMYQCMRDVSEMSPLFLKRPHRSLRTAGQLVWRQDEQFDIDHHVRHSALPQPGRIRELLDLCGRLHGTRLARERPGRSTSPRCPCRRCAARSASPPRPPACPAPWSAR
jgi:hypothetical protein